MQTYIVYIFTFLIVLSCAYAAQKSNNKLYIYIIIASLTFVAGLRSYTVGIDTDSYVQIFKQLHVGYFDTVWGEVGFKYFAKILLEIYNSPTFVFVVFALVTNGLIVFRLWDFKQISSFSYAVACYYIAFYFVSFNVMRQFFAVAIIFYATRYISKKKYICFLIATAVATLFHTSSLAAAMFIVLEVFQWKYLKRIQKFFIGAIIVFSPLAIIYISREIQGYSHYFDSASGNSVGFMLVAKLIIYIFGIILFNKSHRDKSTEYAIRCVKIYYLLGIILNATGYFFEYMDRIGLPFYVFECTYFGIITQNTKCNQLFKLVLSLLLTYLFIMDLVSNGQGQLPYEFIWQSMST